MSGNEKLWEIPSTWQWAKVRDLGNVVAGGTPASKEPSYWGGNINWISPADLTGYKNKTISQGAKSLTANGLKKSSAKVMPAGSVHFSSRAPIGYVAISSAPMSTNQGFKSLVPKEGVFNEYVYYYLKGSKQLAERRANGTTFLELSGKAFGQLPIPLPPLEDQKFIVAKIEALFSELDKGIESLKTAREQLKVYRQAVLKNAFEGKLTARWREQKKAKLESPEQLLARIQQERQNYLANKIADGDLEASRYLKKIKKSKKAHPVADTSASACGVSLIDICLLIVDCHNKTAPYQNDGIWLIRTPCIRNGKIQFNQEARFISMATYEHWAKRCPPEPGDLIFTREAPMGEAGVVPDGVRLCMGQRMMLLRPPKQIGVKYLLYAMMEPKFIERMNDVAVGTGVKHLRVGDVEKLTIPLFAAQEQEVIVVKLEEELSIIEEQEQEIDKALARSATLRQSILKKAFSGQLAKQISSNEPAYDVS